MKVVIKNNNAYTVRRQNKAQSALTSTPVKIIKLKYIF